MSDGTTGSGESANKCPNCGLDAQPGMSFCSGCGAALKQSPGQGMQAGLEGGVAVPAGSPNPSSTLQPPPPPPLPQQPVYQPPYQQYQQPGMTIVQHTMVGPNNNGLCIAAMVLGIIAVVFFWAPFFGIALGLLATIFGAVGIPSSTKKGQAGKGMGIAGLVMGIIALAVNIIFIVTVWGFLASNNY
jgi:hypothetical protein